MKVDDEVIEEIEACMSKQNPNACIDRVLKRHEIEQDQKASILIELMKRKEEDYDGNTSD